jgi:hypothetical protein
MERKTIRRTGCRKRAGLPSAIYYRFVGVWWLPLLRPVFEPLRLDLQSAFERIHSHPAKCLQIALGLQIRSGLCIWRQYLHRTTAWFCRNLWFTPTCAGPNWWTIARVWRCAPPLTARRFSRYQRICRFFIALVQDFHLAILVIATS